MSPDKIQWLTLDLPGPASLEMIAALLSDARGWPFARPPRTIALDVAVTAEDNRRGEPHATWACPVALAVRRALREALGEAAARFEVNVHPHGVEARATGWPGEAARLTWVAPLAKWLAARIDAFDFDGKPLTGARCAITLDPLDH
jgi:hypothetical protein